MSSDEVMCNLTMQQQRKKGLEVAITVPNCWAWPDQSRATPNCDVRSGYEQVENAFQVLYVQCINGPVFAD